jgi:hypothetical protein
MRPAATPIANETIKVSAFEYWSDALVLLLRVTGYELRVMHGSV